MGKAVIDLPTTGGFNFNLSRRNQLLIDKKVHPLSFRKTGTTIAGLIFQDELLWAAAWLYHATQNQYYLNYLGNSGISLGGTGWAMTEFGWDVKYAGVQVLVSKILMQGRGAHHSPVFERFQEKAEFFLCSCLGEAFIVLLELCHPMTFSPLPNLRLITFLRITLELLATWWDMEATTQDRFTTGLPLLSPLR